MVTVLLDTNMLLVPHLNKVDIFAEINRLVPERHEVVVPDNVLHELGEAAWIGEDRVAANVGIKLLEKNGIRRLSSQGYVDDFLVEYADQYEAIVATNDKELKRRLRDAGAQIITLKGKKALQRI